MDAASLVQTALAKLSNLLDNECMGTKLSKLFAYPSRTEILETLYFQCSPIHLRQIGDIAHLPVRSTELALKDLQKEKLVIRKKSQQRMNFSLNRKHEMYPLLNVVFQEAMRYRLQAQNLIYTKRGKRLLMFVVRTNRMMRKARRSYRGTR